MSRRTSFPHQLYFFDRFEENCSFFQDSGKFHTISIKKSLVEILTTRASYFFHGIDGVPSMFGIPDLSLFDPSQSRQWPLLEDFLSKIVSFYEPRLKDLKVSILSFDPGKEALDVHLAGFILIEKKRLFFEHHGVFQC